MRTRICIFATLIGFINFAWVAANAGTPPSQPANLANENCACVSPVEPPTSNPTSNCSVCYAITYTCSNSFTAVVTIQNKGTVPVKGWTVHWGYTGNQTVTYIWNGGGSQCGKVVSITNAACNQTIPAGGTVSVIVLASYSGANINPTTFTLQ